MNQLRMNRDSALLMIQILFVLAQLGAGSVLAAQVTITNTGSSGSSGIQMTNGASVGASTSQVSIWADSGSSRGILNNGNFASAGPVPIAVWPCTYSLNVGGIVYGMTGTIRC